MNTLEFFIKITICHKKKFVVLFLSEIMKSANFSSANNF